MEDAPPTQSLAEDATPTQSFAEDAPPTLSPPETDNEDRYNNGDEKVDGSNESRQHSSRYSEDDGKEEEEERGNISLRRIDAQEKVEDPQLLEALRQFQTKQKSEKEGFLDECFVLLFVFLIN